MLQMQTIHFRTFFQFPEQPLSTMPAKKRMKLEMSPEPSQTIYSSQASIAPSSQSSQTFLTQDFDQLGFGDGLDGAFDEAVTGRDSLCKSEDYELVKCDEDEVEDNVAEGDVTCGDPGQLASYSPFLARNRDFYGLAVSLMRLQGIDLRRFPPTTKGVVREFFQRYHPFAKQDLLWSLSFEEESGSGPRTKYRATLTTYVLNDRKFQGKMSSTSMRLAEESAVIAFREDPEVREIAKVLPPPRKKIKEWVHLNSQERERLVAAGFDTSIVLEEFVQSVYMHFRELGCRTALWDGNA